MVRKKTAVMVNKKVSCRSVMECFVKFLLEFSDAHRQSARKQSLQVRSSNMSVPLFSHFFLFSGIFEIMGKSFSMLKRHHLEIGIFVICCP